MSMYPWVMGHPKTVRWAGVGGAGAQDSEGQGRAPLILPPPGPPSFRLFALSWWQTQTSQYFFHFPPAFEICSVILGIEHYISVSCAMG